MRGKTMKTRWLVEVVVTSIGLLAVAACATGGTKFTGGTGGDGGDDWTGGPSATSSSSSSNGGGAGGAGGSSSNGAGGGAVSSSASSAASSSSSSSASSSSGVCGENPCKLVAPQCGCAGGEMCTIDGMGGRLCIAAGSAAIGQACVTSNDCAAGGLCAKTATNISMCAEFCATDATCTSPGGLCTMKLNDGSSGQIPGVTLCSENCDPLTNTGCFVGGSACHIFKESGGLMRHYTNCSGSGTGMQGAACTNDEQCAPTFSCINAGTKKCLKYCKVGGAACPGGLTCASIGVIGGTEYGACL